MFKSLHLQNFQSHKNSYLEFSPGVNVIIGESDVGKSAILRAIYWLVFGRPSGDSMRRHRTDLPCSVQIDLGSSQVERVRGGTDNYYVADGETYKGFGQSVPQPVVDIFNMTELNFMRQMDPPFLFSKSSGEVAQYLNRLINLEVIDKSLSNIKRMHTKAEQDTNQSHLLIRRTEKELQKFDWLPDADVKITKLEKLEKHIEKLKRFSTELDKLCLASHQATAKAKQFYFAKQLVTDIEYLEKQQHVIATKKAKCITLENAVLRVQKTKTALGVLPNTKGLSRKIVQLEIAMQRLQQQQGHYNGINIVVKSIIDKAERLQKAIANHKQTMAQLQKVMPNICPLCEQPIRR